MITETDKELILEIHHRMFDRGISLVELADAANIKASNLLRILELRYSPSIEIYERIGVVLGIKLSFIKDE